MFCHKIYYIEMLKYYSKQKYNTMKRKKKKKEISCAKKRTLVCFFSSIWNAGVDGKLQPHQARFAQQIKIRIEGN